MSLQINFTRNKTGSELVICTACVEGPKKSYGHGALQAKIILADFNLVVSTPTAKPPKLIPHQNLDGITNFLVI